MEKTECLIRFNNRSYTLSVETLHHRFFRGSENRFHAHASYHYVLVSQGSCQVHIRGRQPAEAPLNSLVFINPLIAHNFIGDPATGVEHTCLIWRFLDEQGKIALFPLQQLLAPEQREWPDFGIIRLNDFDARNFLQKQRAAELAYNNREDFSASVKIFELFFLGLNLLNVKGGAPETEPDNEKRIVKLIEQAVERSLTHEDFSIGKLSRTIGLHPNYLNTVFKSATGITLSAYIIQRRIDFARMLLESTSYNLSEIAEMCGFRRLSYFSRVFRKHCGTNPSSYRNRRHGGKY